MQGRKIGVVGASGCGKTTLVETLIAGVAPEFVAPTLGSQQWLDKDGNEFYEVSGKPRCLRLIELQREQNLWIICVDLSQDFHPDAVETYINIIGRNASFLFVGCKAELMQPTTCEHLHGWLTANQFNPRRDLVLTSRQNIPHWRDVLRQRIDPILQPNLNWLKFFNTDQGDPATFRPTPAA